VEGPEVTNQKTFKHRIRARMTKTGESYTAARRQLIAKGDHPEAVPTYEPLWSDQAVIEATGRGWEEWFKLLDDWDGTTKSHPEIARWLVAEQDVSGWWAQSITVGYERARGLRAPGQHADGWAVTATKTIGVPVGRLFAAFEDDALRKAWLPGVDLRLRTARPSKSARYDWEDGSSRVDVGFEDLGVSKSRVAIQHARLPDGETAEEMKTWWRGRVSALKTMLEGEFR
jgi:hypothetical protein